MAVVGVVGGSGGVGASTFAAVLAECAAPSTLIDCDAVCGGIDVLLGVEFAPGSRWSGLRVDGGTLDPGLLDTGLPHWHGVRVLAADTAPVPAALEQVVEAAGGLGPVMLDVPRAPGELRDAALRRCALCIVVAVADVPALAAARAVLSSLPELPVGAVVRRGSVAVEDAAVLLGVPVLGTLPDLARTAAPCRASARVAAGLLDGLVSA